MEKKAQDESSKETFKLFSDSSLILGTNKINSNEKICNDPQKVKNTSKLPRIVRMPTRYYKPIETSSKSTDDSGDSLPGPSNSEGIPIKLKKEDTPSEKFKISHIPRLKSHKEGPKENNVPSKKSRPSRNNRFIPECRNVQRVNILINPEFCPDDRAPPVSIQSTRPIPTLGHIYGHMNMIDSQRLNDWFMELRAPMNTIRASNVRTTNCSGPHVFNSSGSSIDTGNLNTVGYPAPCHQEDLQQRPTIVMETENNLTTGLQPINENANPAGVEQSTDVDFPTRDNDSGYNTISLKKSQKSKPIVLKKSEQSQADEGMAMNTKQTYCVGLVDAAITSPTPKTCVECSTDTNSLLRQQPTVVLCGSPALHRIEEGTFTSKSYVSLKPSRLSKTTEVNNNTCCSNANQTAVPVPRLPVPSYTDCFSEVLQKTTNFEAIEGIDPTKSPSSGAVMDIDLRENIYIIEGTRLAIDEMCEVDNSTTIDSSQTKESKSSDNTTYLRSDATVTEWSCKYRSEHSSEYHCRNSFRRELGRRYYDDSLYNEMRERCNTCHRFKRFPSTRYKLPRSFGAWRSGGSIRRLCCRRWNHVWKKTAERWAIWSTRSPAKSRRLKNLVRSVIWEDVDVQTNILIYNERGTDGALNEQKSAAINTVFGMGTLQATPHLVDSGSKTNKFSHVNSGPSMFPYFPKTKGKTATTLSTDKNLSGYQFPNCQQNQCTTSYTNNTTWNADAAVGLCNSVKSCQYQGEIAVQEQTTSLDGEVKVNLADRPTDTADLPSDTIDQKTSTLAPPPTPAPAPILFGIQKLQINKDSYKMDAVPKNVIMCHNAEADVKFPFCGGSSSITVPSESDIIYYRPVAASDITQLISETRTQQALFPILRRYYSNAASAVNREKDSLGTGTQISPEESAGKVSMGMSTSNPLTERTASLSANPICGTGTQISPGQSVEKASMGVSTSNHLTEKTTSFSADVINGPVIKRVDCAVQTEEFQPKLAEVIETQMTPLKTTSVASAGITPSEARENDEVFLSECVLTCNDAKKENLSVQTRSAVPKLAFTGPKIVSISSQELPVKMMPVLYSEEKTLTSNVAVTSSSKGSSAAAAVVDAMAQGSKITMGTAVGNNTPMDSKANNATADSESASSDGTVSSKCYCISGDAGLSKRREVVSCGTSPNTAVFNLTRSTSARGLDSYYDTEILLNNLIKKALIGTNIVSQHTRSTDKSDTSIRSRHNMIYVTTSTKTNIETLETKSIGPTASDVSKLTSAHKTDAEIQYFEQLEKTASGGVRDHIVPVCTMNLITNEAPAQTEGFEKFEVSNPPKSAAMMTSYCGLAAAIQVPAMSAMTIKNDSRKSVAPPCSSNIMCYDMETNTNYKQGPVTEDLAQTSMIQTTQKSLEVNIYRNCPSKPASSKAEMQNSVNNQLLNLSRLIGKKRTNSSINMQVPEKWIHEYPYVDTSAHPTKLPNSFKYNSKNAFESIMLADEESQIRNQFSFSLKTDSDVDNPVPYELPTLILSKDSLADVLPVKSKSVCNMKSETELALNRLMIDQFTSDNYVSKDVKESILQACPEICNTGTEPRRPSCSRKSACVLTTQCVLPPTPPCGCQSFTPKSRDCVFLYGVPRCVVHNVDCADAAIQLDPPAHKEVNVRRERVTHSTGQLTSHCSLRNGSQRNPSTLIREVLSPKVYKALYDTTKLVVSQDKKQPSSRNATVVAGRVDAEVDAAQFDMPKLKSVSVLTSEAVMESQSRCHCGNRGSHYSGYYYCPTEEHGLQILRSEESHRISSHVSHEETDDECCEACMKRHLVTSCRYYSNLLTKHLSRVKDNLTKHLAPSMEKVDQQPQPDSEACTMKPSGRNEFASQTLKHSPYFNPTSHMPRGMLSPATSLTNICKYDKAHLKSVYFMLSAIEGRLRRLKWSSSS